MREYTISLPMDKGLRPHYKTVPNSGELVTCHNVIPSSRGYIPFDPIINPINADTMLSYGIELDWPYPQLFVGKSVILLATRNKIYSLNRFSYEPIEILTYDINDQDTEKEIVPGHAWSFIDMWGVWMLSNGACTVIASGYEQIVGITSKVFVAETPLVGCGTYHQGRVFMGGFDPAQFWSETWKTFWSTWRNKNGGLDFEYTRIVDGIDLDMPIEDNFVWWSSIGAADALSFFYPVNQSKVGFAEIPIATLAEPDQVANATYNEDRPWLLELWQRNEQGFAPMPYIGKVKTIMPLGEFVVVYSTGGIMALKAIGSPEPTMQQIYLGSLGVPSAACVAGDLHKHMFIDAGGSLWMLDGSLQLKPLGYKEWLSPLLLEEPILSYSPDPTNTGFGELYIGSTYQTYVYNGAGLSTTDQRVTSACYHNGYKMGYGTDTALAVRESEIVFDRFDFSYPGVKTIEQIALSLFESTTDAVPSLDVSVAVDYRYAKTEDYKTTNYVPVNAQGVARIPCAGLDFRVRIKANDYSKVDLNGINVTIKTADKRFVRGILPNTSAA